CCVSLLFFVFNATPPTYLYTLSLHDALPISFSERVFRIPAILPPPDLRAETTFLAGDCNNPMMSPITSSLDLIFTKASRFSSPRSEEHTSELQSRENLVCRLLLEKKNKSHSI